jgi:hypothetical protein
MRNRMIMTLGVLGVVSLTAWMALAANIHFIDGLTCNDEGTTLQVCGKVAGLGNQPLQITVTADATIVATCTNKGGNAAPGQNKVTKRATGTVTISPTQFDKNGNVTFCVSTDELTVSAKEAGCPNNNWEANPTDVAFTNVVVTATQGTRTISASSASCQ